MVADEYAIRNTTADVLHNLSCLATHLAVSLLVSQVAGRVVGQSISKSSYQPSRRQGLTLAAAPQIR